MKLAIIFCALLVAVAQAQQLHCTKEGSGNMKKNLVCYDNEKYINQTELTTEFCSDPLTDTLILKIPSIKTLNGSLFSNFKDNCHFKTFVLFEQQVEKIEQGAFENFPKLTKIMLVHNKIKFVMKNAFKKLSGGDMPNIERLFLQYNEIATIEEGAFTGLIGLKDLCLSNNKFTEINLTHLPNNLQRLLLNDNDLEKLTGEPDKYSVYTLDVSSTKIKPAQLSVLKADVLEKLYIARNGFTATDLAPLARFKNLKYLNVDGNHLDGLQASIFDSFPLLEGLDLTNTGLKNIHIAPILVNKPKLKWFYFGNNEIDKFDFDKLPSNIETIGFYGNKFNFKCSELRKLIRDLNQRNVQVLEGFSSGDNVDGIACH